jgi:hypothetical protein
MDAGIASRIAYCFPYRKRNIPRNGLKSVDMRGMVECNAANLSNRENWLLGKGIGYLDQNGPLTEKFSA